MTQHLLFLSHAGVDTSAARTLVDRIEQSPEAREQGLKVWFDQRDLAVGTGWQQQLERVIERDSTAFAVLVGTRGIVNWVESEVRVALTRAHGDPSYPLIPIISQDCKGSVEDVLPPFVRLYQGVRNIETDAAAFARLLGAALRQTTERPRIVDEPFVGLRSFDGADAFLFFGRARETEELLDRVRHNALVMVVGDSGSGKSSLVKAGLVPRFRGGALADPHAAERENGPWHVVEMRPRRDPFEALADSLSSAARDFGVSLADIDELRKRVRSRDADAVRDALVDGSPSGARTLLVVDQFEELWTQCDEASRQAFAEALLRVADLSRPSPVRAVLTMRRDYYNLCHALPGLYAHLERSGPEGHHVPKYPLRRIDDEGVAQAIAGPLELAGVPASPALSKRIVADIGDQPAHLTLVQVALQESWRRRRQHEGDLLEAYVMIGGVAGALAHLAEELFTTKLDDVGRRASEAVFLRLVRLGETGGTTRRVASREEFSDEAWRLVQSFASPDFRRLVAVRGEGDSATAELCHEALATQWPRYQAWLYSAAPDKQIHDRLIPAARRWNEAARSDDCLLVGRDLDDGRALRAARPQWFSPTEETLLEASEARRAQGQAEAEERQRREIELARQVAATNQRRVRQVGTAMALVILAAIAAGLLWLQARATQRDATDQLISSYWDSGIQARDGRSDPLTAAHYFARAADADPGETWTQAVTAAEWSVRGAELLGVLSHTGPVSGAVFDGPGSRVLTWSEDGSARVWNATTGAPITAPLKHEKSVKGAVFDGPGARVLTWSEDGSARVWHATSGAPITPPLKHERSVNGAVFDGPGSRVLTWSEDGSARVWKATSGTPITLPLKHEEKIMGAAFDGGTGARVLTWSWDGSARVWNASSGAPITPLLKHKENVVGAAFDDPGARVLTWSGDGSARVWNATSGAPITPPLKHDGSVLGAAFDGTGARVLTWSEDGSARIWNATSGAPITPRLKHDGSVTGAAFDRPGARVLTWSWDRSARVWNATNAAPVTPRLCHRWIVLGAAFDGPGARVLTWSGDESARVWNATNGAPLTPRLKHEGSVIGAAFDGPGARVLTWSWDGSARVWNAASGEPITPPLKHAGSVIGAAFAPRGARVLTWNEDGSARVWNVTSHAPVTPPLTHEENVMGAAFDGPNARVLTWSENGSARIWNATTGAPITPPLKHAGVSGAVFDGPGSRVLTWSWDGSARVWNATTGAPITPPLKHAGGVSGAVFDGPGSRVLTWSWDGSARVWNATTGAPITPPLKREGGVSGAVFGGPGSRVLTWSQDGSARFWNVTSSAPVTPPLEDNGLIRGAAFDGPGARVVTWNWGGSARVWNATTGAPITPPLKQGRSVNGAVFDGPGSRVLTWSDDGSARVWNATSGAPITQPLKHKTGVNGAVFDGPGSRVLTWSDDGSARVWNATTGAPITPPLKHESSVRGAVFDGPGARVLTWSEDGSVRVWPVSPIEGWPRLAARPCVEAISGTRLNAVGDLEVLTAAEWQASRAACPSAAQ